MRARCSDRANEGSGSGAAQAAVQTPGEEARWQGELRARARRQACARERALARQRLDPGEEEGAGCTGAAGGRGAGTRRGARWSWCDRGSRDVGEWAEPKTREKAILEKGLNSEKENSNVNFEFESFKEV